MEKELMCKVCDGWFTHPVLLPCGHSLCLGCAERCYKYDPTPSTHSDGWLNDFAIDHSRKCEVNCPCCGSNFQLPSSGVYGLARNTCLESVITKIKCTEGGNSEEFHCEFCVDAFTKAIAMCENCNFWYCDTCLESMHPPRGPLSTHSIVPPGAKSNQNGVTTQCAKHAQEKTEYFCLCCNVVCCITCRKEFHKAHIVEDLQQYLESAKGKVQSNLEILKDACTVARDEDVDHERVFMCLKSAANETEAYVKRETDKLIALIKNKRENFLQEINKAYLVAACKISDHSQRCQSSKADGESLIEFVNLLLRETNPLSHAQVLQPMLSRLKEAARQLKLIPKADWSAVSKFSKMSIDVTLQEKTIRQMSWLKVPGPPSFIEGDCFGRNCRLILSWNPPEDSVDSYILEVKVEGKDLRFTSVYEGTDSRYVMDDVAYGSRVIARVKARNSAGSGAPSEEISVIMPIGFELQFSPDESSLEMSLSTDLKSIKSQDQSLSFAIGDSLLSSGIHYWCARIIKFPTSKVDAFVSIGIISDDTHQQLLKGMVSTSSYAVEISFSDDMADFEAPMNRVLLKKPHREIKDMLLEFILNLDAGIFNVFATGFLISSCHDEATFRPIANSFFPCVITRGEGIRVDFISGLRLPQKAPGPPDFVNEKCFATNTKVTVSWTAIGNGEHLRQSASAYLVEFKYSCFEEQPNEPERYTEVYRGCKTQVTVETSRYGMKVKARVRCVNFIGIGDPSEEIIVVTSKGLCFKIDEKLSKPCQSFPGCVSVSPAGRILCQPEHVESCFLGDVDIATGRHCWGFKIEKWGENSQYIACGIAKEATSLGNVGANSENCVIIHDLKKPMQKNIAKCNKRIPMQQESALKEMTLTLVLDMDNGNMFVYINGILFQDGSQNELSMPTLSRIECPVKPAIWIGGGAIALVTFTGLQDPGAPGPPIIKEDCSKVLNTDLHLEWTFSDSDCIDYFIVQMAIIHNNDIENENEKLQDVYVGRRAVFESNSLPYNSEIMCRILSINSKGRSEPSSVFKRNTSRGFKFGLDKTTAHPDLKIRGSSVSLMSPVYATVLGNVPLSTGCHYWEILIERFHCQSEAAVVGIGVARKDLLDPILGEDVYSYALQLHQHPKIVCTNTSNKIQLKKSSKEVEGNLVGVYVDLDAKKMDIYYHGSLVLKKKTDKTSFKLKGGSYFPALSLYGTKVKLSLRTGVDFNERFSE